MRNMTKRRRALMNSSDQSRLPEEYQEVAWLQGTGSQWCNLPYGYGIGLTSDNHFYGIKGDLEFLNSTGYAKIVIIADAGRASQLGYKYWRVRGSYGRLTEVYHPGDYGTELTVSADNNLTYHFEINKNSMKINNSILSNPEYELGSYCQPYITVGAMTGSDESRIIENSNVLIKEIKLTLDDVVYCEFIPCYRVSDNKAGLFYWIDYEQGTSGFITNRGTGSDWLIGPDI